MLARVARREVDILVGTQMVTKGHDFPGVTLVGVLCADTGLNLPDFRASERTFQLLAQVAGRAGRGERPGRVLIQTYRPSAPAVTARGGARLRAASSTAELAARAELGYPPHGRLIAVRIDGPDAHEVAGTAQRLAQLAEAIGAAARTPAARSRSAARCRRRSSGCAGGRAGRSGCGAPTGTRSGGSRAGVLAAEVASTRPCRARRRSDVRAVSGAATARCILRAIEVG